MSPPIAQIVVGLPVEGPFDYSVPADQRQNIAAGQRVSVSFGRRQIVGFVVGFKEKSNWKTLKPINAVLENVPSLDPSALQLTKKISEYYGCSWGEAIETSLPSALRQKKILQLSINQPSALGPLQDNKVILCHDQGTIQRWPFILEQVQVVLEAGRSVLVLAPETSALAGIQEIIKKSFSQPLALMDKALTPAKELEQWIAVKEGRARIIIGTRSAIFTPTANLGLIVILEEENLAYKQEQAPFYHAHDVARFRQEIDGTAILYVSSTPSVELWHQIKKEKRQMVNFAPEALAPVKLIDLNNYKPQPRAVLSYPLQNLIMQTLVNNGKAVLFFNRRGFSTTTRCNQCGYTVLCPRCNVHLPYFYNRKKMACPLCNYKVDLPAICPKCQSAYMRSFGGGVEKLESEVARAFPQAKVAFFDRETDALSPGANIIVATQAIVRELPNLRPDVIGVVEVDSELSRTDFRCAQKVFSLLVRFRQYARQSVMVQTHQPDNYCLRALARMDFEHFYKKELTARRELGFPPFKHLVAIGVRGLKQELVQEQAAALHERLSGAKLKNVEIFDPQPDFLPKLRDKYRFTIMLKGKALKPMLAAVKAVLKAMKKRSVVVTVNVDP